MTYSESIRGYRVRAHNIEEGWNLCKALMTTGCEGVLNESSRYNDTRLGAAFQNSDYCYVGIWGMPARFGGLRIVSTHDKEGKKYLKEVSRSKIMELYGITYKQYPLPRSLQ